MIAYCWQETPGVSSFGEYTGSGSTPQTIECGFAPAFVMVKNISGVADWAIFDSSRGDNDFLIANTSVAENNIGASLSFTDTGFTVENWSTTNGSGQTFIYAAFAISSAAEVIDVDVAANTMTVDGGSWSGADGTGDTGDGRYEPTQEWSADTTTNASWFSSTLSNKQIFDGDTTTKGLSQQGGSITFNFTLQNVTSLAYWSERNSTITIVGNSGTGTASTPSLNTSTGEIFTVPQSALDAAGTTITQIILQSDTSGAGMYCYGVYVNGKLLVDASIPSGGGKTRVTGSTETAEGTFLEADGTEVDLSSSSGRWIADNKDGIDFTIAGPSIVDAPLLTADITLVSSQFATTPINQDSLKNAKWIITKQGGSTEVLNAGAVTSYNPPNGTFDPNSTYTVSVEYEGFA